MDVLSKILLIFFSLAIMPDLYINENYLCIFIGSLLVLSLIKNLCNKWNDFFNGRYEHRYRTFGEFNSDFYNDYNYSLPSVNVRQRRNSGISNVYVPSFNDDNDVIKDVEGKCVKHQVRAEFLNEDNMIIPFNKTTTIVKTNNNVKKDVIVETKVVIADTKKNVIVEVDNINKNRPNINKDLEKDSYTTSATTVTTNTSTDSSSRTTNSGGNAFIFINESELDKNVKGVYCSVIDVLTEKKYPTSKICRMLKSIQYVDLCDDAIVFYVNKNELESTDILPKEDIISKIRTSFRGSENIEIVFEQIKTISMFDFYMSDKK